MIFYGISSKSVSGYHIDGMSCSECGKYDMAAFGFMKYFYLYWIPIIPTSNVVCIECQYCKRTLVDDEIPQQLVNTLKNELFTWKRKLPLFSGAALILLLVSFAGIANHQENITKSDYINNPKIGDLYVIDFNKLIKGDNEKYHYGLMRVKNMEKGMLELQIGKLVYNKSSGVNADIRKLDKDPDYFEDEPAYNKAKELNKKGAIYSVTRKS